MTRYISNPRIYYNTLRFSAFLDRNSNNVKDSSEPNFRNAKAMFIKQGGDTSYLHSATGLFEMDIDTGAYKVIVFTSPSYYNPVPAVYNVTHTTYFNRDTFAIALQPIAGIYDLAVAMVPLTFVRPGFITRYLVKCYNKGTESIASGSFRFVTDSRLVYSSASQTPAGVSGDTLTWNFTNLQPRDSISVVVQLNVKTPPAVQVGDTIRTIAWTNLLPTETQTKDNGATLLQLVRNSADPNDKTEAHGGKIPLSQALAGEYLTYTIRFQNTGNDTAFNVYIHDTLDSKLDWSSLQMITASHNYQLSMNDGKCKWTFANIMLVDSNKNEPLSHGYVVYRVKAKPNAQLGDVIKNKAAIYFDYNLPIITNTETTTLVADALPLKLLSFMAKRVGASLSTPAPTQFGGEGRGEVLLQWTTTNEVNVDRFEVERSTTGRDFSKLATVVAFNRSANTSYAFTDEHVPANAGTVYYRLKMIDRDGTFEYSPIRQVSINSSSLNITLYPNPAKDVLQVLVESDKKRTLQVQLLSLDGKVLQTVGLVATEGSTQRSINVSRLQKGSYLLKITSGEHVQVMKFEKM